MYEAVAKALADHRTLRRLLWREIQSCYSDGEDRDDRLYLNGYSHWNCLYKPGCSSCGTQKHARAGMAKNVQKKVVQECSAILLDGNGSLVSCFGAFEHLCVRSKNMHDRARRAVQTLRVLRFGRPNIFDMLQKQACKMMARIIWASWTDVSIWRRKKRNVGH